MDDKDLEAIVQRMIDAGESEESIARAIQNYQPNAGTNVPGEITNTPPPAYQRDPQKVPGILSNHTRDSLVAPGMLSAAGYGVKKGAELAFPGIEKAGKFITNSRMAHRGVGVAAGAATMAAGRVLGAPNWMNSAAGLMAYGKGRQSADKIGKILQFLGETGYPESIYAGQGLKSLARKGVQYGFKMGGMAGKIGMAAEAAKLIYDRTKNIPQAIRDNPNMLAASPGYQTPEDEAMIRALLDREQQ